MLVSSRHPVMVAVPVPVVDWSELRKHVEVISHAIGWTKAKSVDVRNKRRKGGKTAHGNQSEGAERSLRLWIFVQWHICKWRRWE